MAESTFRQLGGAVKREGFGDFEMGRLGSTVSWEGTLFTFFPDKREGTDRRHFLAFRSEAMHEDEHNLDHLTSLPVPGLTHLTQPDGRAT